MVCRMLIEFLRKLAVELQSQRLELYQANQLTDKTQREKIWLFFKNWKSETELFRKIVQEVIKKSKNEERNAAQKLQEQDS